MSDTKLSVINEAFLKSIASYLESIPEDEELLLNRKLLAFELRKVLELIE